MINHGFRPSEILEQEHYILGDGLLKGDILMTNGHGWEKWLPEKELQNRNGLETMNCTNYAILNAIEALGRKKYGACFQNNLSERYTGVMTNTTVMGNDPHSVAETIRTWCGVVPEVFLPFTNKTDSWEKYYSPKPMQYWLYVVGRHWLKTYDFRHSWVFTENNTLEQKQNSMKFSLQYSPLATAGFAWSQHGDGVYYSDQPYQNHYFVIYDYVDGVKWLAYDSYDNTKKELDWNFKFTQCKMFTLNKRVGASSVVSSSYLSYALYRLGNYAKEIIK